MHPSSARLYFFRAADGAFITKITYVLGASYDFHYFKLVVSSDSIPIVYVANGYLSGGTTGGYLITSITFSQTNTAPNWTMLSTAQTSTDLAYGLTFAESSSYLYVLGYQSTQFVVSRLSASTGANT